MEDEDFLPSENLTEKLLKIDKVISQGDSIKGKKFLSGWSGVSPPREINPRRLIGENVIGTIAMLAYQYQEKSQKEFTIAEQGRFSEEFSTEFACSALLNSLSDITDFYTELYDELSGYAKGASPRRWGRLTSDERGIYVVDIPEQKKIEVKRERSTSLGGLGFD